MVEAMTDYESDMISVMTFKKGDLGVVVSKKDANGWLGVKIAETVGWVPSHTGQRIR